MLLLDTRATGSPVLPLSEQPAVQWAELLAAAAQPSDMVARSLFTKETSYFRVEIPSTDSKAGSTKRYNWFRNISRGVPHNDGGARRSNLCRIDCCRDIDGSCFIDLDTDHLAPLAIRYRR